MRRPSISRSSTSSYLFALPRASSSLKKNCSGRRIPGLGMAKRIGLRPVDPPASGPKRIRQMVREPCATVRAEFPASGSSTPRARVTSHPGGFKGA